MRSNNSSRNISVEKTRGAYFTPPAIAEFLAYWAVNERPSSSVLDPSCGEGVFLLAAANAIRDAAGQESQPTRQLFGVDIHSPSLITTQNRLAADGASVDLYRRDFFEMRPPPDLSSQLPMVDAVVGNPPFVRYQDHSGTARHRSLEAALRQGVRLSGLASSWAALLVHASSFLKPDGRLAMVLPAEMLTVGYAEPVRQWLKRRFAGVKLVLFERLQFSNVLENVLLLLAHGNGGCDAFSVYYVEDAEDLGKIQPFDELAMTFAEHGKWTDLLLPIDQRQLFRRVVAEHFVGLAEYGPPELGTVTGANGFFALSESTRREFQLKEDLDVVPISPPGTRHFKGVAFTAADWNRLRDGGERVWLLAPEGGRETAGLRRYVAVGEKDGVDEAYKCRIRSPWWRPPVVPSPDLFFTYMSHRYPRLVANRAGVGFLNSMHGIRLVKDAPRSAKSGLPFLVLNSVTMLGAEINGRSYGGGVLKMEPREAGTLPVPAADALEQAWRVLSRERASLERQLRNGCWTNVVARVDDVLLRQTMKLNATDVEVLHASARALRSRRMSRSAGSPDGE